MYVCRIVSLYKLLSGKELIDGTFQNLIGISAKFPQDFICLQNIKGQCSDLLLIVTLSVFQSYIKCISRSVVFNSLRPRGGASQDPLSMEFPWQEYWSGLPFPSPGDLPNLGIRLGFPALQVNFLLSEPQVKGKSQIVWISILTQSTSVSLDKLLVTITIIILVVNNIVNNTLLLVSANNRVLLCLLHRLLKINQICLCESI